MWRGFVKLFQWSTLSLLRCLYMNRYSVWSLNLAYLLLLISSAFYQNLATNKDSYGDWKMIDMLNYHVLTALRFYICQLHLLWLPQVFIGQLIFDKIWHRMMFTVTFSWYLLISFLSISLMSTQYNGRIYTLKFKLFWICDMYNTHYLSNYIPLEIYP